MHSFTSCLVHCVFSTKEWRRLITPALQERLWPYLGGIAREHKMKMLAVDGIEDHVHALLSIPATLSMAKAVQLLKATHQNGFMRRFRISAFLDGRKVTEPSASACRALTKPSHTLEIKRNIIVRALSRKNSSRF